MTIYEYADKVRNAASIKMIEPNGIYSGKSGHIRFARECGYALNDFSEKDRDEFLHSSYSNVYVRACFLRPLIDASLWIDSLRSQIKGDG